MFHQKPLLHISVLCCLAFGLTQCMTTGTNFPSETNWIQKNKTNQKDVATLLGTPFSVGSSGGIPTWTYAYYSYNLFKGTFHKELKLYWGEDKNISHYSFSSSFPGDLRTIEGITPQTHPQQTPTEGKPEENESY